MEGLESLKGSIYVVNIQVQLLKGPTKDTTFVMSIDEPNDDKLVNQWPVDEVSSMETLTGKVSNKK